jgi:hypothetical protein
VFFRVYALSRVYIGYQDEKNSRQNKFYPFINYINADSDKKYPSRDIFYPRKHQISIVTG